MSIRWSDPPRDDQPRLGIQIVSATVNERHFRFLGEIVGVHLHYFVIGTNRSLPCRAPDCPYCGLDGVEEARWHGYAPAQFWSPAAPGGKGAWVTVVLHLTESAVDQLRKQHGEGTPLRGLVVGVKRGLKQRSKVELRVREHPAYDPDQPSFDVRPILMRVWNIREAPPSASSEPAGEVSSQSEEPGTVPFNSQRQEKKRGNSA